MARKEIVFEIVGDARPRMPRVPDDHFITAKRAAALLGKSEAALLADWHATFTGIAMPDLESRLASRRRRRSC